MFVRVVPFEPKTSRASPACDTSNFRVLSDSSDDDEVSDFLAFLGAVTLS